MNFKQLLAKILVVALAAVTLLITAPEKASADVRFCAPAGTPISVFMTSPQETGVIFFSEQTGEGYEWANNYYGDGAGGEWQSPGGPSYLPEDGCYMLEVITKDHAPGPGEWYCEYAPEIYGNGAYQIAFADVPYGPPTAFVDIAGTTEPAMEVPEQIYCTGGYR
ncbi:MAG: hypothetical protein QNJ42_01435 [Crocosphaera sp.]|nr:hypothetical protein [Crocosphaera sp.]